MERCYNCGIILNKEIETKEHIPARNLYNGFPTEFKNNLLTVPACYTCNQEYSKIDQEIRDAIGIMNEDDINQQEITRQSVKSILRKSNWKNRIQVNENGAAISVTFNYDDLKNLHIKNFKGIFIKQYEIPIPDKFIIEIVSDGDEEFEQLLDSAKFIFEYIQKFNDWKEIGHKDVFMYSMKTIDFDKDQYAFDSGDINNCKAVIGVLVYHQKLCAIVVAAEMEFLNQCKP